jgi:hypothetical protein
MAVGQAENASAKPIPLGAVWNGTSWVAHNPIIPANTSYIGMVSVACTATSSCQAAGYYETTTSSYMPLAEVWNGSGWSQEAAVVPLGGRNSEFDGISCASSTACEAVGAESQEDVVDSTLAERFT